MNKIIKQESAIDLFGIEARSFAVVADDVTGRIFNQKISATRYYEEGNHNYRIAVELRFDDQCNNGHETFSITATIDEKRGVYFREYMGGCCHDEIAKHFPELAHLIKWHLTSTDGPMYYVANTLYHAAEHGPNKAFVYFTGEGDPLNIGDNKERLLRYCPKDLAEQAEKMTCYRVEWDEKTAKTCNIEHARSSAVWPDATIEQLRDAALLEARLPELISSFHLDMMRCGFVWPVDMVQP